MSTIDHSFVSQFTDITDITVGYYLEGDPKVDYNALVIKLSGLDLYVTLEDAELLHRRLGEVLAARPADPSAAKDLGPCGEAVVR